MTTQSFFRQGAVFIGLMVLALLVWQLSAVFLLLFGGIVIAVTLQALMNPFARLMRSRRLALMLVTLALAALIALGVWLAGGAAAEQARLLRETLPQAAGNVLDRLHGGPLGPMVRNLEETLRKDGIPWMASAASVTVGAVSAATLVVVLGFFLAANPGMYRRGFVRLFPVSFRPALEGALDAAGRGLHNWLVGQLCSMAAIGTMTGVGLWLLDMPLAFALGCIAAVLEFVPFFGPVVSGILAVMLAFTQGPQLAFYVALLCLGIQQIEGNLLMPLIQRWAVRLPPVLGLVAVVVFGILFGLPGVLLATPLMVVVMIVVKKLYIEEMLEKPRLDVSAR